MLFLLNTDPSTVALLADSTLKLPLLVMMWLGCFTTVVATASATTST